MTPSWLVKEFSQNHGRLQQFGPVAPGLEYRKLLNYVELMQFNAIYVFAISRVKVCAVIYGNTMPGLWDQLRHLALRFMESVCGDGWPRSQRQGELTPKL